MKKITLEFCYPSNIREGGCSVSYNFEGVSVRGLEAAKDIQPLMDGLFRKLWKAAYGRDMTDEEYDVIVRGRRHTEGKSQEDLLPY